MKFKIGEIVILATLIILVAPVSQTMIVSGNVISANPGVNGPFTKSAPLVTVTTTGLDNFDTENHKRPVKGP